ncbi:MAG: hypothetical protein D4R88_08575 [Methanosarcinales archaeon]|nr:MAG: hypothetical protein D4R88_08575 [Methanosarcinales archaeon]
MAETVSVKISRDAKILLDTIHQKLRSSGVKITEQKILDALIEYSDVNVVRKLIKKEENIALSMLKKPVHWGIEDSSEDIDRYLYGGT